MKTVVHLLAGGGTGGIEILCKDYAKYSKHKNIFVMLWYSGIISDEMKNQGHTVIELKAPKSSHLKNIKELQKIVKQYHVDTFVVHHASPILHMYMMAVKCQYRNLITIAYAHGLAEVMYRKDEKKGVFFRKKVLQQSLKKANYVVAVSDTVKKSLIQEYKISQETIEVIYNGVDLKRFSSKSMPDANDSLNLIYVGRLIENKGVQLILQAVALWEYESKIHLTIVGDGSYKQNLEDLVKKLRVEDKVTFLGNRKDVPELLQQTEVFLHVPILEEGFGITVIEAMACGKICVCSKSGALPEIIREQVNGFLVEKNSAKGICECIKFISNLSQKEKDVIKENAIKRAMDFSIDRFVDRLDMLIDRE